MTTEPNESAEGVEPAQESSAGAEGSGEARQDPPVTRAELDRLAQTVEATSKQFGTLMDELRARSRPAGGADGETGRRTTKQALEEWAAKGDFVSAELLQMRQEQEQLIGALTIREQLSDYPKAERNKILQHFSNNRDRFASVEAAAQDLEGSDRAKKLAELEEQNRKLQEELRRAAEGGKRVNPDVIRTELREEPVGTRRGPTLKMTQAEYDRQQERETDPYKRMEQQRALAEGRIDIAG